MNIYRRYLAYIRNNPNGYWFKRRPFGWGWVPARWQGWAVIIGFIAIMILNSIRFELSMKDSPGETQVVWFLLETLILVSILIATCFWKGEEPRWSWGFPEDEDPDEGVVK